MNPRGGWADASLGLHGGPDARGVPLHDFSTNSNACGPCPSVLQAVQTADPAHYPDPHYTALTEALAQWHGVEPDRVVLAGSASEFIHRITALAQLCGARQVSVPRHAYGDYAQAAWARGLAVIEAAVAVTTPSAPVDAPGLQWACEPASPLGGLDSQWAAWQRGDRVPGALRVLDCAYAPLRLDAGAGPGSATPLASRVDCWQLWTPNKALGLTGVRAAYAIAPAGDAMLVQRVRALAPSWPVGAHGVAMLQCWVDPLVQQWLADSRATLRAWKARQQALCEAMGWSVLPGSLANFFGVRPRQPFVPSTWDALREAGIKLRDAQSFGLPGVLRLGVLPPASQEALFTAWQACHACVSELSP